MLINPLKLFKEAVAKYPKVKGLFGVLAALALVVLVLSLRVSADYAVFGVIIVLGFLALVALAVAATQLPKAKIGLPALVFIWAVLILSIGSISFLFTGYFFNWPRPIRPNKSASEGDHRTFGDFQPPRSLISPAQPNGTFLSPSSERPKIRTASWSTDGVTLEGSGFGLQHGHISLDCFIYDISFATEIEDGSISKWNPGEIEFLWPAALKTLITKGVHPQTMYHTIRPTFVVRTTNGYSTEYTYFTK